MMNTLSTTEINQVSGGIVLNPEFGIMPALKSSEELIKKGDTKSIIAGVCILGAAVYATCAIAYTAYQVISSGDYSQLLPTDGVMLA